MSLLTVFFFCFQEGNTFQAEDLKTVEEHVKEVRQWRHLSPWLHRASHCVHGYIETRHSYHEPIAKMLKESVMGTDSPDPNSLFSKREKGQNLSQDLELHGCCLILQEQAYF